MTAGELLVKLGFEVDTLKLNEFIKDLGELNFSSVVAAAGMKELVDGLSNIMKTADAAVVSLNKLSTVTGVAPQVFQQWDNAAQQFNMSAGETNAILSDIQKQVNLLKVGQGNAVAWAQLFHIPIAGRENDPAGVFHDILKSMEGMDPAQRRLLLNMAGINEDAALLVGHEDQIVKQVSNTAQQLAQVQRFSSDIKKLANDWLVLIIGIAAAFSPILDFFVKILDAITDMVIELEKVIPTVLAIAAALTILFSAMKGLALITGFLSALKGLQFLLPFFEGLATVITKLNPILAVAGGIALAGGLLYDLLKPKNNSTSQTSYGGDSNQTNHYNIQSNDPNDIMRRISEYHQTQNRDVQGQSPLTSW